MWESQNYVWFTEDELGKGATAAVYKCRQKNAPGVFAVKVFTTMASYRYQNQKECDMLKTVKHENIVTFFAAEQETLTKSCVIIMEYCNDGSLQSFLSRTENAYGLCETDLLAVLHDLVSGLKYLRSKNVVHRDIKPLNIMRTISASGIAVHKLADFGTARVLEDDQGFESIVGTEEYLHPDVFTVLMPHKRHSGKFRHTCDLWSIGVTMYYCVAGKLPFSSFGGRNDRETMYRIISERQPEMISGIQEKERGPIVWSSVYPAECLLPRELLSLLLPIQRGLFETREDYQWTFEAFFEKITDVLERKKIQAVDVFRAALHNLYLQRNCGLTDIQREVSAATGLGSSDLLLLCNNSELDAYVTTVSFGESSVHSSGSNSLPGSAGPLFVFSKNGPTSFAPNLGKLLSISFGAEPSRRYHAAVATARRLKFAAEDAAFTLGLVNQGVLAFLAHQRRTLMTNVSALEHNPLAGASSEQRVRALEQLSAGTRQFRSLLDHFTKAFFLEIPYDVYSKDLALSDVDDKWKECMERVKKSADQLKELTGKLHGRTEDSAIVQQWTESAQDIGGFNDQLSYIRRLCVELVKQGVDFASRSVSSKKLYYDRLSFDDGCYRLQKLYSRCDALIKMFSERFGKWIKGTCEPYTKDLRQAIEQCDRLASCHEPLVKEFDSLTTRRDDLVSGIMQLIIASDSDKFSPCLLPPADVSGRTLSRQGSSQSSLQRLSRLQSRLQQEASSILDESRRVLQQQ